MNKLELIAEIKGLIRKANTEQALDRLVEELEKAGSDLAEDAIKAQSQFKKTQRDESRGSISFENAKMSYSQVDDQIFNILDVLEQEAKRLAAPPKSAQKMWLWGGGAVLVLALAGVLIFNNQKKENPIEPNNVDTNCPAFDSTSAFKVLIFPFLPRDRDAGKTQSQNTTKSIFDKLINLSRDLTVNSSIKLYTIGYDTDEEYNNYPSTIAAAQALANSCRPDLIICGTTEKQPSGAITTLNYKFLNSRFTNLKLNIMENSVLDTLTSVSSILTENSFLTADIEAAMRIIFGMIANETGNTGAAIAELENLRSSDSLTTLLSGMTLAGSYIAEGQRDKAKEEYSKTLSAHPHYWLALNNRAALSYEAGNNAEAIEDMDALVQLRQSKKDTAGLAEALTARSTIYLKSEALDKAQEDVNKAEKIRPRDSRIQQLKKEVNTQIKAASELKDQAEEKLQSNPKDVNALLDKASASRALGYYEEAASSAEALVKRDPQNAQGYAILIEAGKELKDNRSVQKWVSKARQKGVKVTEIVKNAPLLENDLQPAPSSNKRKN